MYCRNNWLTYSFGGNPRRIRDEDLTVQFTEQADKIIPLDEVAQATAKEIHSLYPDIYVAMSGGCDSEYVAKSFKAAGVPFKAITMTCKGYLVIGEWYTKKWCDENDVELIKFEVDPFELLEYGKRTVGRIKGISWFGSTVNLVANEVERRGGYLVTGALPSYYPDPKLRLDKADPEFVKTFRGFMFDESDFYIELVNPNKHPWAFFYWSPEMLASVIYHWDTSQPVEDNKWRMFNVLPRPKLTGCEFFTHNHIAKTLPEYNNYFKWTYAHRSLKWGARDFAPCPDREEFLKILCRPQ
jgi:hypothetical protein